MDATSDITLRTDIQPGDLGRVLHLHGVVYGAEMGFDLTMEGYVAATLGHFAEPVDLAQNRLWLAESAGRLVGCIAVIRRDDETGQLRWFLVDPKFRGRGLGRRLVGDAVAFARQAGYHLLYLETVRELPVAAALYRKAGFVLVHEEPGQLWGGAVTEQRYELRW